MDKLQTTQEFSREQSQSMANEMQKTFVLFLHKGMWHTIQEGIREVPANAKEVEYFRPN